MTDSNRQSVMSSPDMLLIWFTRPLGWEELTACKAEDSLDHPQIQKVKDQIFLFSFLHFTREHQKYNSQYKISLFKTLHDWSSAHWFTLLKISPILEGCESFYFSRGTTSISECELQCAHHTKDSRLFYTLSRDIYVPEVQFDLQHDLKSSRKMS